jgi:protein-L-isoaspartate(D-aspartate) O-methyltransferase
MFNTLTKFATNDELVQSLNESVISDVTKDVMKQVNRRNFINDWSHYLIDKPQRILKEMVTNSLDKTTLENQTISAPTMHANAIEYLKNSLRKGAKVLDVGSGSGYLTVCFAKMVHDKRILFDDGSQGKVIGIDVHPELIEYSQKILDEKYPLEKPIVTFQVGSAYDFYEDHLEEYFDAINVGATALELPLNLVRLLKKGGQMVIPLKRFDGSEIFTLVEKDMNGNVIKKELMNVVYVPLVK